MYIALSSNTYVDKYILFTDVINRRRLLNALPTMTKIDARYAS